MAGGMSRRSFVRWLGVASAGMMVAGCGAPAPGAAPTAAPPPKPNAAAPTQAAPVAAKPAAGTLAGDWDALVAAAKQEGKVVIQTPVGPGYREAIDAFMKAFPGIEAEQQAFPDGATYVPKITGERKAGLFTFDVGSTTVTPMLQNFKPDGFLDPIRPVLVHPEALDDKAWYGGIEARWADLTKSHVFRHQISVVRSVYVNTNLVKEDDIKTLDDLLDPKWKGQIVTSDVGQGYVYTPAIVLRDNKGEEWLRRLFVDQQSQMVRDRRQAVETLVRGGAAIGFGLHPLVMNDFKQQGLADHIKNPEVPGAGFSSGDVVVLFNKAPHPNAAKLFINWLLTKEGQTVWSTRNKVNSARTDIPPADPNTAPGKVTYVDPTQEEWLPKTFATQEYLKKLVS